MALEFLGIETSTKRELHRDPSWMAAREAIDLLDGESVSMVRLATLAGTSLSIGGGEAGRYVVSGVHCNGSKASLVDPMSVGGVVSKPVVLKAAELFWRNGNFDSALSWQSEERKAS